MERNSSGSVRAGQERIDEARKTFKVQTPILLGTAFPHCTWGLASFVELSHGGPLRWWIAIDRGKNNG
jgi:hypothetical protein